MADRRHSLVPGAALLAVGLVFALDRFGFVPFGDAWYWGLVVAGGLVFLFDRFDPRGLVVAAVGLVLWATDSFDLRIRYVWPLLLIGIGGFLVSRAIVRNRRDGAGRPANPGSLPSDSE